MVVFITGLYTPDYREIIPFPTESKGKRVTEIALHTVDTKTLI